MSKQQTSDIEIPKYPNLDHLQSAAVYYVKMGESYTDVCSILNISRQTLWRWRKLPAWEEALKLHVDAELFRADFDLLSKTRLVQNQLFDLVVSSDDDKIKLEAIKTWLAYVERVRKRADDKWPTVEPLEFDTDVAVDDLLTVIGAKLDEVKSAEKELESVE